MPRVAKAPPPPALAIAVTVVGARDHFRTVCTLETRVAEAITTLLVALTVTRALIGAWLANYSLNLLETHGSSRCGMDSRSVFAGWKWLCLQRNAAVLTLETSVAVALAVLTHSMVVALLCTGLQWRAGLLCLTCLTSEVRTAEAFAQPANTVLSIAVLRALPLHMLTTIRARELWVAEALAQLAFTIATAPLGAGLRHCGDARAVCTVVASLTQATTLQADTTLRAAVGAWHTVLTSLATEARVAEALTIPADTSTRAVLRAAIRLGAVFSAKSWVAVALAKVADTVATAVIDALGRHLRATVITAPLQVAIAFAGSRVARAVHRAAIGASHRIGNHAAVRATRASIADTFAMQADTTASTFSAEMLRARDTSAAIFTLEACVTEALAMRALAVV